MAIFDRSAERIVVRVVYDGLGNAGKSTNVRQLRGFFTPLRRSEIYVPEERSGRTMYFDWLQIESGLVGGHRLRCEALSVPGQLVLRQRRARLLQTADVVVMVCDSSREGAERVRRAFKKTRAFLRETLGPDLPVLVQANKQDMPGALSAEQIAEVLELEPHIPVIPARADEGIGVRETAVLAIRAAADRVQRKLLADGLESIAGTVTTPEQLYADLRSAEIGQADALSIVALLDDDDDERGPPPEPEPARPSTGLHRMAPPPIPLAARLPAPSELAVPKPMSTPAPLRVMVGPPTGWPTPPVGAPNIPSGLVWPSATGREALRRFKANEAVPMVERLAQSGALEGAGKHGLVLYEAGGYAFKTTLRRRFTSLDDARAGLIRLVRDKLALGSWMPADTIVVATESSSAFWLWTVAPWLETLQARLVSARRARDEALLADALASFADAAIGALRLRTRSDLLLDVHPSNFAESAGGLVYLDDEVQRARSTFPIVHAMLQRVEEYVSLEGATIAYVEALAVRLAKLTAKEHDDLSLIEHLRALTPRTSAAERARQRLLGALAHAEGTALGDESAAREVATNDAASIFTEAPTTQTEPPPAPEHEATPENLTLDMDDDDWLNIEVEVACDEESERDGTAAPPTKAEAVSASADDHPPTARASLLPPLPQSAEDLPSGYIWPPAKGRELVRRILGQGPLQPADVVEGETASVTLSDGMCMSTSVAERYGDSDEARAALAQRARKQVALSGADSALVFMLVPSREDGSCWIWTIHAASAGAA